MYNRIQRPTKTNSRTQHKAVSPTLSAPVHSLPNSVLLSLLQQQSEDAAADQPNQTGRPDAMKARFERMTALPLDDVWGHRNSDKPAELCAAAYAQGNEIYLGQGQEQHLEHELGHVMQQKAGNAQPTLQLQGVSINDDIVLEKDADDAEHKLQNGLKSIEGSTQQRPIIQRQILIGNDFIKHYDQKLIDDQFKAVKPYINTFIKSWNDQQKKDCFGNGKGSIKQVNNLINNYLDTDVEGERNLKNDIQEMLRKYQQGKAFDNKDDLSRQLVQDIKLKLLGLDKMIGINHQDGQFSTLNDDSAKGRTGKTKPLRIYRTMPAFDWNAYETSEKLEDILKGHGGSLGQALHYFETSKKNHYNDVLVEYQFEEEAQDLIDYSAVKGGNGEGKDLTQNDKLIGKCEKNDILGSDVNIFSIYLGASKKLIKKLNPKVRLIDRTIKQKKCNGKAKNNMRLDGMYDCSRTTCNSTCRLCEY